MANQANDQQLVNANGAWTYMARVRGLTGANITQASLTGTIKRYLTSPVGVYSSADLVIASVVSDALITSAPWDSTRDTTGYNFIDAVDHTIITSKGIWLLQYCFTALSGAKFRTREIDLVAD